MHQALAAVTGLKKGRCNVPEAPLIMPVDVAVVEQTIPHMQAETDAEFPDEPQVFSKCEDVLCLKTVNRLGAFMAWTRGPYYFSAHARGGEEDLHKFMESFPY